MIFTLLGKFIFPIMATITNRIYQFNSKSVELRELFILFISIHEGGGHYELLRFLALGHIISQNSCLICQIEI